MTALQMTTLKNVSKSNIINMDTHTIKELRALAKERGLKGYYKLPKAGLISLLETPIRPPRRLRQGKTLHQVTVLPKPEDMDTFEQQEMAKNRSVVKAKLNEWYDWLVGHVPTAIKDPISDTFSKAKSSILRLYNGAKEKLGLKEEVEKQAAEEEPAEQSEEPVEHERAMNGSYKSFRIDGEKKAGIVSYIAHVTPKVSKLIVEQVKVLNSAKIQMHMWVMWKKVEERLIRLEDEDFEAPATYETQIEKVFNSKMTEVFQGSDIGEILHGLFAHIKTQVEHPSLPKSGFTLDYIMHLDIDFHRLQLTRGSSYIPLPEWIGKKKAVINPKNTDDECFKWAVIAALHNEEIDRDPQRITKLEPFADRYKWGEFPMPIEKIGKFEKENPEIAVNVLFASKKSVYIARRSSYNCKRRRVNLLLIVDGEKRHYTAIKSLSRLLKSLNANHNRAYHFCVNCLNGFRTESERDKHYEYCSSNGEVKVKKPKEKDKWLQFYDGQCQFKVPSMLYADFESILKPVDDKRKASQTEKVNVHIPSGWCVLSKFAYGDVPDPMTAYRGEDCVEKFVDHLEREVNRLYETFPQQPMVDLTDAQNAEYKEAESCHICLKSFNDPSNYKVRDHCHYTGLYRGPAHNNCNLKYKIPNYIPIAFHNLSGYDAHLFIKELGKKFNKEDIEVIAENKEKYISFSVKITKVKLAGVTKADGKPVYKEVKLRFIDSCRFMASG